MIEHNIKGINFAAGRWPLQSGHPTLVFIHGVGNSHILWKAQVEGLAESVNTVALDLPGHGRSEDRGLDSIAAYADAVNGFIDAIQAPCPIPCGLSMGGAVVLQMLLGVNGSYRAGIIINSGARLKAMPAVYNLIRTDYSAFAASMATTCISVKTDPLKLHDLIDAARRCDPDVVCRDFLACDAFDVRGRLNEITAPLLVLTAEEDRLTPPWFGQYLAMQAANALTAHIKEAGHLSPLEQPEEVNRLIGRFVQQASLGCSQAVGQCRPEGLGFS